MGFVYVWEDCFVYCVFCLLNSYFYDYNGEFWIGNNFLFVWELISSLLDFLRKKWGVLVLLVDNFI